MALASVTAESRADGDAPSGVARALELLKRDVAALEVLLAARGNDA